MDETFVNWTEQYGVGNIADTFGISKGAVWHWRAKRSLPKMEFILRMVAMSKGQLDADTIIKCTMPVHMARKLRKFGVRL